MSDLLVLQSISESPNDIFVPYMELQEPIHREWARRCDADYEYVRASYPNVHPAWNRIRLTLDAFDAGYRRVMWLDADTLVVDQDRNPFAELSAAVPVWMIRVLHSHVEFPWKDPLWDSYNDGVMLATDTPHARAMLEHVWAERSTPLAPHHIAGLWELNDVNDYVYEHPDAVAEMPDRWNWLELAHASPRDEACILAWHGRRHDERWREFSRAYVEHYA